MSSAIDRSTTWLDRAHALLERETTATDLPSLLRLVDQGIAHRRRLGREPDPDAARLLATVDEATRSLRSEALRHLSDPSVDSLVRDRIKSITERRLAADQAELSELLGSPDLDPLTRMRQLNAFRLDLLVLGERVSWLEDLPAIQPSVSARIELNRINASVRRIRSAEVEPRCARLDETSERLRRRLLDEYRERLLESSIDAAANPVALWERHFQLSRLQAELASLSSLPSVQPFDPAIERDPDSLVPEVEQGRARLAAEAAARLSGVSGGPEPGVAPLVDLARAEAQEALALAEDLPPAQAVVQLRLVSDDLDTLRQQVADATRAGGARPSREARTLRSIAGTLRGEWQEKDLADRLRRTFGATFVRFFDGLILVLILVLTLAIVAETALEATGRMTPFRLRVFAWLDLVVCVVFLFEFGLKWSLARGKWRYFRRHALLDLLPSIPFGFLAYEMGTLIGAERVQLLRLLRVPRMLRYLRLAQPVVRVFRLFVFLFRFFDRLVRRYANLFNRNIILFEPIGAKDQESRVRRLYTELRRQFDRRYPEHEAALGPAQALELAESSLDSLSLWIGQAHLIARQVDPGTPTRRDVRLERLVEDLIELTPDGLVERMGTPFAESIDRMIRLLDAPLVRRLPLVSQLVAQREKGPAESASLAANILGSQLQRLLDLVYFVADLQATVSPPLFLDKLGRTIVNATRRPAFRLVTLGLLFGALWAFLHVAMPDRSAASRPGSDAHLATRVLSWIERFTYSSAAKLGPAVIALGVICALLMLLGNWLRKIANQTSEFSERVVEAQFAAQTKSLKRKSEPRDLRFIGERVIVPELRLRASDDRDAGPRAADPARWIDGRVLGLDRDFPLSPGESAFLDNLRLLYDDFLDGPPFHRTDTKTSTQLLGNLALQNLNRSSLTYLLNESRRLRRLDLNRAVASLLGGPYLWFDYITRLIVQQTAQLLVDFNRNAVPWERLASSPRDVRERYRAWLARRLGVPPAEVRLPAPVGELGDSPTSAPATRRRARADFYETVEFSAVDFLGPEPARDQTLGLRFGPQVLDLVRRERERNLRRAFRSFPLHRAPVDQRTLNAFYLYERYLSSGRVALLPFRLVAWSVRGVFYAVSRVAHTTRDLLRPPPDRSRPDDLDTFAAAMRKIHRMRKPAFMESLTMRARFDVEYLSLPLPSIPISLGSASLMESDLDFIGASRHERVLAERFRDAQRKRLRAAARWIRQFGWRVDQIGPFLEADFPHLADRSAEVVRALVAAFLVDHEDIESLANSIEALRAVFLHAADPEADLRRLPGGIPEPILSNRPLWYGLGKDRPRLDALFELPCLPTLDEPARRRVARYLRRHRGRTRGWIRVLLSQGGADPIATLRARMLGVILRADLWSEQILVLRMVQTLTMLDLQHYAELVWTLGAYESMGDFSHRPNLPFLDSDADDDEGDPPDPRGAAPAVADVRPLAPEPAPSAV